LVGDTLKGEIYVDGGVVGGVGDGGGRVLNMGCVDGGAGGRGGEEEKEEEEEVVEVAVHDRCCTLTW